METEKNEVAVENKEERSFFNWKKMFWLSGVFIVVLGFVCGIAFTSSMNNKEEAEKYKQMFKSKESLSTNLKDSLNKTNARIEQLSSYQPLTSAMIERDKVRSTMKYQPGDFAIMKVDSLRVLVVDIVAGGDKFNYTLKYKIQHRDKSTEDVSPQLLYGKTNENSI